MYFQCHRRRFTRNILDGPVERKSYHPERKSGYQHAFLHARHLRYHQLQQYRNTHMF